MDGIESPELLAEIYEATLEEINDAYEDGQISEEEAEDLIAELDEDAEGYLDQFEEEGYFDDEDDDDYDDEDEEDANYSSYGELATFRAGNDFGNVILEEIALRYPDDPDEGIIDLAEAIAQDPEDLLLLLSGEYAPDDVLVQNVCDAFGIEDEETYYGMLELGAEARGEDYYYDEDEDDEDEVEEAIEDIAEVTEENYSRLASLEAQFSEAQVQRELSDRLYELERRASDAVSEGRLPPVIYNDLFGNFESDSEQIAAFSAICDQNNSDPETELYAIERVVESYEKFDDPYVSFSQQTHEPISTEEYRELEAIEAQARRNVEFRRSSSNIELSSL